MPSLRPWLYILTFLCFLCSSDLILGDEEKTRIGLWVPCEGENQTLSSSKKIVEMLDFALSIGSKDIFLQIYRRNYSWYPSKLANDTPYQTNKKINNVDTLSFAIQEAHKRGIRIHGWFNIYWIGKSLDVPIIKKYGKKIITCDQKGRSLADYPNNRIPAPHGNFFSFGEDGYWLEPGDPHVQSYYQEIFKEVMVHYPDLDGIHMDFVRYPFTTPFFPGSYYDFNRGISYGYGSGSVERFIKKYHLNPVKMERTVKNCALWDQWRRDQITDLIDQVRGMLRHQNKKIELSCATLPWPERSYFSSLQDWMKWVKDGHVDFIVNMNYTLDLALSEYLSRMALSLQSKGKVWIGLGPYLFKQDAQNFSKEMNTILLMKPEGIVLFSYDGLLKQPSLVQNLQKRLKRKS